MDESVVDGRKTMLGFVFPRGQLFSEILLFVRDAASDAWVVVSFEGHLRIYRMNPSHTVLAEAVVPPTALASYTGTGAYLVKVPQRENLPTTQRGVRLAVIGQDQTYRTLVESADCSLSLETEEVQATSSPVVPFEYEGLLTSEEFAKIKRIRGRAKVSASIGGALEVAEIADRGEEQRVIRLRTVRERWIRGNTQDSQKQNKIETTFDSELLTRFAPPRSGLTYITLAFAHQAPLMTGVRVPLNGTGIACTYLVAPLSSDDG